MTFFVTDFTEILRSSGISTGDTFVFEFTGPLTGEFEGLEEALRGLVGENGLLVVPTCTHKEGAPKPPFNKSESPSEMGPFSEAFRRRPGVLRSNHATHSLAAWGGDARALTQGHRYAFGRQTPWGESAFGLGSPWDGLLDRDAWWALVNPDWHNTPLAAYASALFHEQTAGVTKETPFPRFDPAWLEEHFAEAAGAHEVRMGGRRALVFRMRQAVAGLLAAAQQKPLDCFGGAAFRRWYEETQWLAAHGPLKAGAAKVCITPAVPFARWEGKPMLGVYRDLYARAVSLQSGSQRFVLVLCDLIGITRDLVLEVRRRAAACFPEGAPAIMIACTHAHSTPDTIGAGFTQPEYLNFLVERLVQVIREAAEAQQPARMGWSKTTIRGVAGSRRWKLKDGSVFTTRYGVPSTWRVDPARISGQGVIDPELTVLRIERMDGSLLAGITNFGVHPSIAMASALASGDFSGEAMHLLEQVYGAGAVVLCTTGAAADVDPTLEMPVWGPRSECNVARIARLFAAQALEQMERTPVVDHHEIQTITRESYHSVRPDWSDLFGAGAQKMQSEYADGFATSAWISEILRSGGFTTEVQAVRLNDLTLLAFPGEVFTSTCLDLKARAALAVLETTNDYIGYIPPEHVFAEGGYECAQHFASRVYPLSEEILRKSAESVVDALQARYFSGEAASPAQEAL